MSDDDNGITISYRVKDILDQIMAKLDTALAQLDKKADRADLVELKLRVTALELRKSLEEDRVAQKTSMFSRREKLVGLVVAVAAIVGPFLHFIS